MTSELSSGSDSLIRGKLAIRYEALDNDRITKDTQHR